jgi:hypothetical protein
VLLKIGNVSFAFIMQCSHEKEGLCQNQLTQPLLLGVYDISLSP